MSVDGRPGTSGLVTELAPPAPGAILRAEALEHAFGLTPALRGVDASIGEGEVVAVMGPSGSGKSTLLHCLAGILRPDGGSVEFDGRRIDALGDAERSRLRRADFGFVFQFGQLVPELPAVENVALPLMLGGMARPQATARAAAMFPKLGLDGLEGRRPGEMSGGQAQRVAVARALVTGPRVVFADEPTGSLDSLAGEQVMELLTGASRAARVTVLLVTHEPRIAAYADREVVMRDGRVVAGGAA
ncbi:MAG: ABC transporter ATP-binding protein [Candidatus Limnocylindrales bacterium]